jgi:Fe-S-cluster containining protein
MMETAVAKCLSFHAAYQCRRSGACCSAGWTIPFNTAEVRTIRGLTLSGRLQDTARGATAMMAKGRCSFLEREATGAHACEIHRIGGHAALPLACRMFPRIVLHDPRGTFISLSHYCPTAAAMLFEADEEVTIVDAAGPLAGSEPLDGLDARDVWPPLLRPGVMMDLDSYDFWERCAIAMLTLEDVTPRRALDALHSATAQITAWDPAGDVPLDAAVREAFAEAAVGSAVLRTFEPAVKRWLAARLFGSWIAYQGDGLLTIVCYLRMCLDTFEVELARDNRPLQAIRRADQSIVHEASSQQLATLLNVRP